MQADANPRRTWRWSVFAPVQLGRGVALRVRPMAPRDESAVAALLAAYQAQHAELLETSIASEQGRMLAAYAAPDGAVLVAEEDGEVRGCVAWRRHGQACEMKRLVVASGERGRGVGKVLAQAVMADAGAHGFRRMFLVTTPSLRAAALLYAALGFRLCAPVRPTRLQDAVTMDVELD
jgi:putative acetyltransferase